MSRPGGRVECTDYLAARMVTLSALIVHSFVLVMVAMQAVPLVFLQRSTAMRSLEYHVMLNLLRLKYYEAQAHQCCVVKEA